MQSSRIYLVGFMGAGKTTMARMLAGLLNAGYSDTDELFEQKYRIAISDFFSRYGEEHFRKLERDILRETASLENTIISTGGGTPCFWSNMEFINSSGTSVYLRMNPQDLASRLMKLKKKRPLITGLDEKSLPSWVARQLEAREAYYLKANILFDPLTATPAELAVRL
jgi:shikimate kinase